MGGAASNPSHPALRPHPALTTPDAGSALNLTFDPWTRTLTWACNAAAGNVTVTSCTVTEREAGIHWRVQVCGGRGRGPRPTLTSLPVVTPLCSPLSHPLSSAAPGLPLLVQGDDGAPPRCHAGCQRNSQGCSIPLEAELRQRR